MKVSRAEAEASMARGAETLAKIARLYPRGTSPLAAIRRKCIDCQAGQIAAIARCTMTDCALWPYRAGCNPFHGSAGSR